MQTNNVGRILFSQAFQSKGLAEPFRYEENEDGLRPQSCIARRPALKVWPMAVGELLGEQRQLAPSSSYKSAR